MEALIIFTALPILLAVIGAILYVNGITKENADRRFTAVKWFFAAIVFGFIDIVIWVVWLLEKWNIL